MHGVSSSPLLRSKALHDPSKLSTVQQYTFLCFQAISRGLHLPLQIDVSKTIKNASTKLLDAFVDSVFEFVDQPLLPSQSNFAPVNELREAVLVTGIEGEIPDNFPEGVYIRIGVNPLLGVKATKSMLGESSDAWVEGEGMVHALYFRKSTTDGSWTWTLARNNRYVESETFKIEKQRNKRSFLPAVKGDSLPVMFAYLLNGLRFGQVNKLYSNTAVFEFSGKFYATSENGLPEEFDILTLETLGPWGVNGAWNRPFTSHPKLMEISYSIELTLS